MQPLPAFVHAAARAVRGRRNARFPSWRRSERPPRGEAGDTARPGANGTEVALGCGEGAAAVVARVEGLVSYFSLGSRELSLIATKMAKLFISSYKPLI